MSQKLLNRVDIASEIAKKLVETVDETFRMQKLYDLARQNSFVALNFFQLVCNINYAILLPLDEKGLITLAGAQGAVFGGGGATQPATFKGKLEAIAEAFRVQAVKMDTLINVESFGALMNGIGAAQIASDAVKALLGAPKISMTNMPKLPDVKKT